MPHIHDQIDFTVEVFVVNDNRVLLRRHDKYGLWLSVGGHVELHEDPVAAAIREVKEEVGLDVQLFHDESSYQLFGDNQYQELVSPQAMNRHRINDTHENVTLVFFAKAGSDKLKLSETEKSDACRWFTKEDLDDSQFNVKRHVKLHAK
ncbi:NUDIX hydrolase, partial [Candidatus Woesearchaeota archaeon]|nr:NUDIX hydrolase [Candidatus Woesearchaeota archaeon]